MIGKYNIKIGDVFGQWEVIGQGSKPYYSKCRCTCGTIRDVSNRSLCAGDSKSCGCNKEYLKARRKESSVKTGDRFGMWKVMVNQVDRIQFYANVTVGQLETYIVVCY